MDVINRANDASVLMRLLCNAMSISTKCTHVQFVEGFSKLQLSARKYEEELRDMMMEGIKKESENRRESQEFIKEANGQLVHNDPDEDQRS